MFWPNLHILLWTESAVFALDLIFTSLKFTCFCCSHSSSRIGTAALLLDFVYFALLRDIGSLIGDCNEMTYVGVGKLCSVCIALLEWFAIICMYLNRSIGQRLIL